MNTTIDFNYQIQFITIKVRNKTIDYLLSSKTQSGIFSFTHSVPKATFSESHMLSHPFCHLQFLPVYRVASGDAWLIQPFTI